MTSLRPLLALWLPVPAFAACGWLLTTADLVVQDGVPPDQQDPLFALSSIFIVAVCATGGLVSLVLAIVGSASVRSRPGVTVGSTVWAACILAPFTIHLAIATYSEPVYADSSTLGQQVPYHVAAALISLLPLALAALDRWHGGTSSLPQGTPAAA